MLNVAIFKCLLAEVRHELPFSHLDIDVIVVEVRLKKVGQRGHRVSLDSTQTWIGSL
jgi:hypothetical protein